MTQLAERGAHRRALRRRIPRIHSGLFAAAFLASIVAGCSNGPPLKSRTEVPVITVGSAGATDSEVRLAPYKLTAGDEFDVKDADAPQYDQTLKISPDGKVNVNLIGSMEIAGRTADEVQLEIRERYALLVGADASREYLIHDNDELEFKFPYYQQLNDQMRVRPDGKIQLQLAGTVQAEGRSPEELEAELKRRYAQFLREPEVTVIVRTATSQQVRTATGMGRGGIAGLQPIVLVRAFQTPQVFITGEVARPGMMPYTPGLTLVQAIAEAGGNLPSGDVTKLVIMRKSASQSAEVLAAGLTKSYRSNPQRDVALQPYDVVLLPPTRAQTLAEAIDRYVYKLFAPLKNSSFGYVYSSARVIP